MSYSSDAYSAWYDREGECLENSAIETYIADAVETITAAHGEEIAREVEGHLLFSVDLTEYLTDGGDCPEITEDIYTLPGVAKLIESMSDYAA